MGSTGHRSPTTRRQLLPARPAAQTSRVDRRQRWPSVRRRPSLQPRYGLVRGTRLARQRPWAVPRLLARGHAHLCWGDAEFPRIDSHKRWVLLIQSVGFVRRSRGLSCPEHQTPQSGHRPDPSAGVVVRPPCPSPGLHLERDVRAGREIVASIGGATGHRALVRPSYRLDVSHPTRGSWAPPQTASCCWA